MTKASTSDGRAAAQDLFKSVLAVVPCDSLTAWPHIDYLKSRCPAASALDYLPLIGERGIRGAEALIERTVRERGADVVLLTMFGDSFHFSLDFLLRLRRDARLVLLNMDDDNYFNVHGKYYGQAADAVVTWDQFAVPAYARLGVPAIPLLAQHPKELYHPVDVPRDIDVSFIGDCTKCDRREYLRFLADSGVAVESFGFGTKNGRLRPEEMSRVLSRTKINLNFTKMETPAWLRDDEPLQLRVRPNKGQPIEAALARSFCLSEYAPGLPLQFEVGKEIDWFDDKASLLEKVRYYLAHDDEREAMAANAYRRASEHYELGRGFPKMIEQLRGMLSQADPYRLNRPTVLTNARFEERQTSVRFVCLLSALRRGQLDIALGLLPDLFQHGPWSFLRGAWGGARRALGMIAKALAI